MLVLKWPFSGTKQPTILCLGSHSDDLEIGCGGSMLRLLRNRPECHVEWIVFSSNPKRRKEARRGANLFLSRARSQRVVIRSFRDGFFPYEGARIKREFEALKRRIQPDLIFTHYRDDLHQDHRTINELTWNTFRDHLILEYEIPKYDGDLGAPNVFVRLSEEDCRKKIEYIHRTFESQAAKRWFSEDTFRALMRLRGMESNSPSRYAEAFYARKLSIGA